MEELRIYLDLVNELGDPFTVFERDWPEDVPGEEPSGRHVLDEPAPPPARRDSPVQPDSAWSGVDGSWRPGRGVFGPSG